jgi:hypothetical protein
MAKLSIDNEHLVDKYVSLFKHESTLGKQSMEQIKNLRLYNLSSQFVNEYLEYGSEVALLWLSGKANADEQVEMREYVKLAFERNGYKIK